MNHSISQPQGSFILKFTLLVNHKTMIQLLKKMLNVKRDENKEEKDIISEHTDKHNIQYIK